MYSEDIMNKVNELKSKHGLTNDEALKVVDMIERADQAKSIVFEVSKVWQFIASGRGV